MLDVSRKVVPDKGSLNREWPVAKVLNFHLAQEFFHLNWNGVCKKDCIQKDMMTGMVAGYHPKNWKSRYLKNNPVFDWQPVKYFVLNLLPHYWIRFLNLPFQPWRQTSD